MDQKEATLEAQSQINKTEFLSIAVTGKNIPFIECPLYARHYTTLFRTQWIFYLSVDEQRVGHTA